MKRLRALIEPPLHSSWLESIRNAKKRARPPKPCAKQLLIDEWQPILDRIVLFESKATAKHLASCRGSNAMKALEKPLRDCYLTLPKDLVRLTEKIKAAQAREVLTYCPMCGTTLPTTFDHYLPSTEFPELSVHPLNLVPVCGICNSKKAEHWRGAEGNRLFLHAYFDDLPVDSFVSVELIERGDLAGVGARFSVKRPRYFRKSRWALIQSHFDRLELLKRYEDRAADEISAMLGSCKSLPAPRNNAAFEHFLTQEGVRLTGIYGESNWRAKLATALGRSPNLHQWVERG